MSQDSEFSFEQGEHSKFELTSNYLELYPKCIASCSKSMEYPIGISDDDDRKIDKMKYSMDTSDENEQIDSISTGHRGNETIVLNDLDEKFVENNLPTGWIKINHVSGLPLYYNKDIQVCSFAKPYYLEPQSFKNHILPVENLPCLEHKLKFKKMDSQKKDDKCDYGKAHITLEEYKKYCKHLFKFKDVKSMHDTSRDFI